MELSFRQVSSNLNISVGTAYNIFKLFENTGNVIPTKPDSADTRVHSGYEEFLVVGLLLDIYLSDVCQKMFDLTKIVVSAPTICRIIRRHGLTRKKIQQIALQRSFQYRGEFMAEVHL